MKSLTKKRIIAAVAATAILGTSTGIVTIVRGNSSGNILQDFNFKGTYSLTAFADEATDTANVASATTVLDYVAHTTTKYLVDQNQQYLLLATAFDYQDLWDAVVSSVQFGYTDGTANYNGSSADLSAYYYSGIQIGETVHTAESIFGTAIDGYENAKLVVAEVPYNADATTYSLVINGEYEAISGGITGIGNITNAAGNTTITDVEGTVLTYDSTTYYQLAENSKFYFDTAKTIYAEYSEGANNTFRVDEDSSSFIQTTGKGLNLVLDLTGYTKDADVLLTINASSTGTAITNLNRYLIISGNGETLYSNPLGASNSKSDCKFVIKSGYKYTIDTSNGLRLYSINYKKAPAGSATDVSTPVTVTVKDLSGTTLTTITENSSGDRPALVVGSALTKDTVTAAVNAALGANDVFSGNIYTDEAGTKAYTETTILTGDTTIYVAVAYATTVTVNYDGSEYTAVKTIGSALTQDDIIGILDLTLGDDETLVYKVNGVDVEAPIIVTAGLTVDVSVAAATTITITNGESEVGSITFVGESVTRTYDQLKDYITNVPSGYELSGITVDGTTLTSASTESVTITPTSTIQVTFSLSTKKTETFKADDLIPIDNTSTITVSSYTGTSFDFKISSSCTVTACYNGLATANDDSGLTFGYGILPSGGDKTYTITAKADMSFVIYYTATDSGFGTKSVNKSGYLNWTYSTGETGSNSLDTATKSNTTAYASNTFTLAKDQNVVISLSANRFVLFGIVATYQP